MLKKIGKVTLYVVTSPLWITATLLVTGVLIRMNVLTFQDIFTKENKENKNRGE